MKNSDNEIYKPPREIKQNHPYAGKKKKWRYEFGDALKCVCLYLWKIYGSKSWNKLARQYIVFQVNFFKYVKMWVFVCAGWIHSVHIDK